RGRQVRGPARAPRSGCRDGAQGVRQDRRGDARRLRDVHDEPGGGRRPRRLGPVLLVVSLRPRGDAVREGRVARPRHAQSRQEADLARLPGARRREKPRGRGQVDQALGRDAAPELPARGRPEEDLLESRREGNNMRQRASTLLGISLLLAAAGAAAADKVKPIERYNAFGVSQQRGKTSTIQIAIERWSTPEERQM